MERFPNKEAYGTTVPYLSSLTRYRGYTGLQSKGRAGYGPVFRICDVLKRIQIRSSYHWNTDQDPDSFLFLSGFQDAKKNKFLRVYRMEISGSVQILPDPNSRCPKTNGPKDPEHWYEVYGNGYGTHLL